MNNRIRHSTSMLYIAIGSAIAGLGLKGFLLPNHFIDGGVTGISMLISELSGIPLAWLLFAVNLPFLLLGYRQIGKTFAIKSILAIVALSLCISFVPYPVVTSDKLLAAVFGGVFVGSGIGLAIRGASVLDGTEILALIVSKRTFATVSDVVFALNVCIFSVAAFFLGIEPALYSMLTYFAASKMIDFLLNGIEELNGALIVSDMNEQIKQSLMDDLGRGVTILKGEGGFSEEGVRILFCVVTRLETQRLKDIVRELDRHAFISMVAINETHGGIINRSGIH